MADKPFLMCILRFNFIFLSRTTAHRLLLQPAHWNHSAGGQNHLPGDHCNLANFRLHLLRRQSESDRKKQILKPDCIPPVTLSTCLLAANVRAQLAEQCLGGHQQARRRRHEPQDKGTMDGLCFSHQHLQIAHHNFPTLQDMKVMHPFSRITEFYHKRHSFHMKISTAARANSFVFESSHVSDSHFSSRHAPRSLHGN